MDSLFDPFLTVFGDNPDFSYTDEINEAKKLVERNRVIEQAIRGERDLDDVLDCLSDQGIDPMAWVDATCQNMEFVIDSGIRFAPSESGLLLPG